MLSDEWEQENNKFVSSVFAWSNEGIVVLVICLVVQYLWHLFVPVACLFRWQRMVYLVSHHKMLCKVGKLLYQCEDVCIRFEHRDHSVIQDKVEGFQKCYEKSFILSFVCLLVHSFFCSFFRWFVCLFVLPFEFLPELLFNFFLNFLLSEFLSEFLLNFFLAFWIFFWISFWILN